MPEAITQARTAKDLPGNTRQYEPAHRYETVADSCSFGQTPTSIPTRKKLDAGLVTPGEVLLLQRAIGNRAVNRLPGVAGKQRGRSIAAERSTPSRDVPALEPQTREAGESTDWPSKSAVTTIYRDDAPATVTPVPTSTTSTPTPGTPTGTSTDLQKIHDAFVSAKTVSLAKFPQISIQQGATVQEMKEAALKKDPPPIELEIIASIVGAAISAVLPGIGGAMAGLTTEVMAQTAINAAFKKGAELASKAAKDALTAPPDMTVAEIYFNGMAKTYPALGAVEQDAFNASMDSLWAQAGTDPVKAQDAQNQAEQASAALTQGLLAKTFVQQTSDGAFSGLSNLLAQSNLGGVLQLETTVANKGNVGGKVIESAVVGGITSHLAGLVAGRPLSAYKMAVTINASYFTEAPKTGDTSASDVAIVHSFAVSIDSGGKAQVPGSPDQWLLDRGGGNALAGAQGLYNDLSNVPIPITSA